MKRVAIVLGAVLFLFLLATRSWASDPAALTVEPTVSSATWTGDGYTDAVVESPDACPAVTDANATCDHVALTVSLPAGTWDGDLASLTASIEWDDPSNDFDLYLYQGDQQLAASEGLATAAELLSVSVPSGDYEIRVVPKDVAGSGYSGSVILAPVATASPTPAPAASAVSDPDPSGETAGTPPSTGGAAGTDGTSPTPSSSDPTPPPASKPSAESDGAKASGEAAAWYGAEETHSFVAEMTQVDRSVAYQAVIADSGASPSPAPARPLEELAEARIVFGTVSQIPPIAWLLLPLGLLVIASVTYLVLEPESDMERTSPLAGPRSA